MKANEFKAFSKRCKDAFGNVFRNGCRVECFPHDVYHWQEVAIDSEGNVMVYFGDHCNRNPESVWGVHTDGKVYRTSHTNGAFQGAVRTISVRDTWATVMQVAHDHYAVDEVPISTDVAEVAFTMLSKRAEEQRERNAQHDSAENALRDEISCFMAKRTWQKIVKNLHDEWFRWARTIKDSSHNIFCSQHEYNVYGWHQNRTSTYVMGVSREKRCICQVPGGLKVSEKEFYKRYYNAVKTTAKTLLTPEKSKITSVADFVNLLTCVCYGFYLVYDKKTDTNTYYIEGANNFSSAPEDYQFIGARWRDGLTKATEEQAKTVKKWELVVGTNELDVAFVNWSKRLWRDPTEEELKAFA